MNLCTGLLQELNWKPLGFGVVLGTVIALGLIFWYGRAYFKRLDLENRGEWDRPLPHRFPKDMVVAVYKRNKQGHRHHRDHYRHRRSSPDEPSNGSEPSAHK